MPNSRDTLATILRGEAIDWSQFADPSRQLDLEEVAVREGVASLVSHRLGRDSSDCPRELRHALARLRREHALLERVNQRELVCVLDILAGARVPALLMKGAPLSYSHYPEPSLRPRCDVDVLVREADVQHACRLLVDAGYVEPPDWPGSGLTPELTFSRHEGGFRHLVDLHWRLNGHSVFGDVLSFGPLIDESVAVESLGQHARAPKPVHALLLACMHRVGHQNSERLIWLYDIHLLVERLRDAEVQEFVGTAKDNEVWRVCTISISLAREHFGTAFSPVLRDALESPESEHRGEASAAYMGARPWRRHLLDLLELPGWGERLTTARQMAFPSREFMQRRYGARSVWPLPLLYLDRLSRGTIKMFRPTQS